jgi:uncharacterized protein
MDLDSRLPESVKLALAGFETPVNLPFARELWVENASKLLPKVTIPTLVLIGGHDLQVDVHADGEPLQASAAGMADVTFAFPPHANHVLKEDDRTLEEVAATPGNGYNAHDTRLDPEALDTILRWLRALFA